MANVNLQQIIGGANLCGVVEATKTGIPDVLPAGFYADKQTVDRDSGEYTRVTGTRTVARMATYGSPSQVRNLKGIEKFPVKLLHTVESIYLPMADYMNLTAYDSPEKQELGKQEVARQVREFRRNSDNLRVAAVMETLFQGAIFTDAVGNLMPGPSGATVRVNAAVPAGNVGQLNVTGTGNIIEASWDVATTAIDKQMLGLRQAATRLSGYPLRYAFYGKNVPNYLTANTKLGNYFQRNSGQNNQFLTTGEIPNPLLGFEWRPAYDAFFEDQNGVLQNLVGDDQVAFTPDPSPDWFGWLEGTYPVPTNIGMVSADASGVVKNQVITKAGRFAYGKLIDDPTTVKMVVGDTFLPVLKVPSAIFIATVKF